jgi:dihydrofolate synthase/folylpolyglutamate synthase
MNRRKMTYGEAIEYLFGLQKHGIKFGLNKTANLLKAFGNPHYGRRYIHIGGSNGKGSVAAMVASILRRAGLKVGLYTSPHLVRFTERFQVDGQEMARETAAMITADLMEVVDSAQPPTFFEVTTAMALLYFAREGTDIDVIEVGMGGRLDATNVIHPLVCVITNISLEHQDFLGRHLMDIAKEKAGIIKESVDLVTGVIQPHLIRLLESVCEGKKAPLWRVGKHVRYRRSGSRLHYDGMKRRFRSIELGLRGQFQYRNAALTLTVTEVLESKGFRIASEHIIEGLRTTVWPGRMHVVSERPLMILDGAHNPGAIRELARTFSSDFVFKKLILVLGIMGDKDIDTMIQAILPLADYVIYTRPKYFRAAPAEELMKRARPLGKPGETRPLVSNALDRARAMADPEDAILVCGSLFTVGEALSCLYPDLYRPDGIG